MTTEAQNKEAMRDLLSVAVDSRRRGKDLCELRLIRTRISGRRVYLAGRNSPLGSCFDAKPHRKRWLGDLCAVHHGGSD